MKIKYLGIERTGKRVEGEIDAADVEEARARLQQDQIRPLRLLIKNPASKKSSGFSFFAQNPRPSGAEFTAFMRQLSTMQGAGIPIVQSLSVLADQVENKAFGRVLQNIKAQIEQGSTLVDGLRKFPGVFDRVFLNLVAAGEVSGALDKVLNRLALYYEKSTALRRKIVGAMTYPALILILVFGLVFVLLAFVVPTFAQFFSQSGKALPGPTQALLDISHVVSTFWYIFLAGFAGLGYSIYFMFTNEASRRQIDPILIQLPIVGDIIRKSSIARFSRTLATMIQSGVPILDALEITANVAGNYAVEVAIKRTRKSIQEGNTIAGPLAKAGVFPSIAVSMIAIGEQTGSLEAMLTKIAEFYEDEVDAKVSALTSILEPLMIVIVGIVVAAILIPMYLPIFSMGDAISGGG